ncbi:MAG: hypothetical protein LBJ95_01350 [Oscillospiraceae bacterium]|jgi:hypothetical protein|nr:hypothetical protein [Oscillospiraceae bacterium]
MQKTHKHSPLAKVCALTCALAAGLGPWAATDVQGASYYYARSNHSSQDPDPWGAGSVHATSHILDGQSYALYFVLTSVPADRSETRPEFTVAGLSTFTIPFRPTHNADPAIQFKTLRTLDEVLALSPQTLIPPLQEEADSINYILKTRAWNGTTHFINWPTEDEGIDVGRSPFFIPTVGDMLHRTSAVECFDYYHTSTTTQQVPDNLTANQFYPCTTEYWVAPTTAKLLMYGPDGGPTGNFAPVLPEQPHCSYHQSRPSLPNRFWLADPPDANGMGRVAVRVKGTGTYEIYAQHQSCQEECHVMLLVDPTDNYTFKSSQ